jgi:1,4-dihydroxy-2-naphthoyl-CoA synthase
VIHSFEFTRLNVDSRVAWLEFSRAPVNAFRREMVEEVREAIATALADPAVRVLVLPSSIDGYFSVRSGSSCVRWAEGARHGRAGSCWAMRSPGYYVLKKRPPVWAAG